jgi:hypothetical protein
VDAFPWTHRGTRQLWRLGFWISGEITNTTSLDCELDWPAQQVRDTFHFSQNQISEAMRGTRQLWPDDGPQNYEYNSVL